MKIAHRPHRALPLVIRTHEGGVVFGIEGVVTGIVASATFYLLNEIKK